MEKKPVEDYIWFGTTLRYLQDVQGGWPIKGAARIEANLDEFLSQLMGLKFTVTERTDAFESLMDLYVEFIQIEDSEAALTAEQRAKLVQSVNDIRLTLMAEARGKVAFVTVEKRLDITKLLDDVRALVTPEAFDILSDVAQLDLNEAGKCIAFERSTAAAFHLLRATEDVLRQFYCAMVRRSRVSPLLWDPMVKGLGARRQPPPAPLLQNLTNIRQSFRNPTQHPEKIYDIEEVQDLWGICIDVIRRMTALM